MPIPNDKEKPDLIFGDRPDPRRYFREGPAVPLHYYNEPDKLKCPDCGETKVIASMPHFTPPADWKCAKCGSTTTPEWIVGQMVERSKETMDVIRAAYHSTLSHK